MVSDLKKKPGFAKYDKGMVGAFELLAPNLERALKHARQLAAHPAGNDKHPNPSTQVHVLVDRLQLMVTGKP